MDVHRAAASHRRLVHTWRASPTRFRESAPQSRAIWGSGSNVSLCQRWIVEICCSCRGSAYWPLRSRSPGAGPAIGSQAPAPGATAETATPPFLFHDEFDGPAGSAPDPSKWVVATGRETIKNPVFWDRPENMGSTATTGEHVFLDGNSNLVIRADEGEREVLQRQAHRQLARRHRPHVGGPGQVRLPDARLLARVVAAQRRSRPRRRDRPRRVVRQRQLAVGHHRSRPAGRHVVRDPAVRRGQRVARLALHVERPGMYFWRDYVAGMEPYFTVPANSLDDWPFNDPGYQLSPMLNLAVAGSGGGDPPAARIRRTCSSTGCGCGDAPVARTAPSRSTGSRPLVRLAQRINTPLPFVRYVEGLMNV